MLQMDIVDVILKDCGWNHALSGTRFLREAVKQYKPGCSIIELYRAVGKKFGKEACCVERCIRFAIEDVMLHGSLEDIRAWFGGAVRGSTGKMSNSQAIATIWHEAGGDED